MLINCCTRHQVTIRKHGILIEKLKIYQIHERLDGSVLILRVIDECIPINFSIVSFSIFHISINCSNGTEWNTIYITLNTTTILKLENILIVITKDLISLGKFECHRL